MWRTQRVARKPPEKLQTCLEARRRAPRRGIAINHNGQRIELLVHGSRLRPIPGLGRLPEADHKIGNDSSQAHLTAVAPDDVARQEMFISRTQDTEVRAKAADQPQILLIG